MKITFAFIISFFSYSHFFSQSDSVFKLDNLGEKISGANHEAGKKLNHCWKFHSGDNIKWAMPDYNDKDWKYVNPALRLNDLPKGTFNKIGWFRIHLEVDSALLHKAVGLIINQAGASEIYLDGNLVDSFGTVSANGKIEKTMNPQSIPFPIIFGDGKSHLLAVRYSNVKSSLESIHKGKGENGFNISVGDLTESYIGKYISTSIILFMFTFYFAFFLALGFIHLALFFFYKANKANLFYSIFSVGFGTTFLTLIVQITFLDGETITFYQKLLSCLHNFYAPALIAMLHFIFYKKLHKLVYIWTFLFLFDFIFNALDMEIPYFGVSILLLFFVDVIRLIITALIKKRDGALLIGIGVTFTIVFFTTAGVLVNMGNVNMALDPTKLSGLILSILIIYSTLSIPLSMSIHLAREFARTSKNLEKKLVEVEDLSIKNIEHEKEKQQILADQNITLEKQVIERTHEVVEQKKVIEEKNKDITDSIAYAKRIQDATLPSKELKYKLFPEAFVLFKPKDVVSGDFYWFMEIKGTRFIAAADCTGHGVPGALVSVVCSNALNRAVKEFKITEPGKILDKVRELVLETFSSEHADEKEKNSSTVKDGMDISLCCLPPASRGDNGEKITLSWAGANNPFWYVQQNEIKEITANKQSIGKTDNPLPFTTHTLELNKGDILYLFTDGYADQFGGPKGKKFKYKQLEDTLLAINKLSMPEQEKVLDKKFEDWKSNLSQVDDVLVIGVKV